MVQTSFNTTRSKRCPRRLTVEIASSIKACAGHLDLAGYNVIDEDVIPIISGALQSAMFVDFNGLNTLPRGAAQVLASVDGELRLNGLTTLTDDDAFHLAAHRGTVELNALRQLSDFGWAHLSEHDGKLELRGINALSASAREDVWIRLNCRDVLAIDASIVLNDALLATFPASRISEHTAP